MNRILFIFTWQNEIFKFEELFCTQEELLNYPFRLWGVMKNPLRRCWIGYFISISTLWVQIDIQLARFDSHWGKWYILDKNDSNSVHFAGKIEIFKFEELFCTQEELLNYPFRLCRVMKNPLRRCWIGHFISVSTLWVQIDIQLARFDGHWANGTSLIKIIRILFILLEKFEIFQFEELFCTQEELLNYPFRLWGVMKNPFEEVVNWSFYHYFYTLSADWH